VLVELSLEELAEKEVEETDDYWVEPEDTPSLESSWPELHHRESRKQNWYYRLWSEEQLCQKNCSRSISLNSTQRDSETAKTP
jgi:hypothetical protein